MVSSSISSAKAFNQCSYCGIDFGFRLRRGDPSAATWQHVIPRRRGGTDNIENLKLACSWCNDMLACADDCPAIMACALSVAGTRNDRFLRQMLWRWRRYAEQLDGDRLMSAAAPCIPPTLPLEPTK